MRQLRPEVPASSVRPGPRTAVRRSERTRSALATGWRWLRGAGAVVVAVAAVEYGVLPAVASARTGLSVADRISWPLVLE